MLRDPIQQSPHSIARISCRAASIEAGIGDSGHISNLYRAYTESKDGSALKIER